VLFTRHARGMTLTPAGVTVLERARQTLAAAHDAERAAESLARAAQNTVALGFVATPPMVHFPELLDGFAQACPECTLRYIELPFPAGSLASWLQGVDAALCYPPTLNGEFDVKELRQDGRSLILSRGHELAQASELAVGAVLDENFVGLAPDIDALWRGQWSLDDHRQGPPPNRTYDQVSSPMGIVSALMLDETAVVAAPAIQGMMLMQVLSATHVAVPLSDATPLSFSLLWSHESRNPALQKLVAALQS
jgi:DNA-binding transcriptional LysR family regulator